MSIVVKHCDALLAKHHMHISPIVLSVAVIAVFGFISPTLLYAAEVTSSVSNVSPMPEEFRPERQRMLFNTSSPGPMLASSTMIRYDDKGGERKVSSTTQARIIQYKTARIQSLKEALINIEQQAKDLRVQLENLQMSSTSSTEALNVGQFNQKINNLLQVFKKANFNTELPKLKAELKNEFDKRQLQMKRELIRKQEEQKREALKNQAEANREIYKKQVELNRETLKNEQEVLREQRKNNLPGAASTSPGQTPAPSTTANTQ